MILSYEEYIDLGGSLSPAAFNRQYNRAYARINSEAFGRISKMNPIPAEIKHLCVDVIEFINSNMGASGTISSESQSEGGVSESISYASRNYTESDRILTDMIKDTLDHIWTDDGVPLTYRGCSDC